MTLIERCGRRSTHKIRRAYFGPPRRCTAESGLPFLQWPCADSAAVSEFHTSVVRNRRLFLEMNCKRRLSKIDKRRSVAARWMLREPRSWNYYKRRRSTTRSTSLCRFLFTEIAGIDDRLRMAESFENIGEARELKAVENKRRMRLQLKEWEPELDEAPCAIQ